MKFVYKWPFFFWLGVLLACAIALVIKSQAASSTEAEDLKALVESSPHKIRKEMRQSAHELTEQVRHVVSKQIFIAEGPHRRLFDIKADHSKITVISKKPYMHVVETFYNAKGYIQQELFYVTPEGDDVIYDGDGNLSFRNKKSSTLDVATLKPRQLYRYFEAAEAMYDFQTHQLMATDVKFWTYVADGHEQVIEPHAQDPQAVGVANRLSLYVSGPNSKEQLSAEHLKVWFTPEGSL